MQADAMNATSLAYIGDALMSLYVREYLLSQGYQKPNDLQVKSTYYVSAKAQAHYVKILMEQSFFREAELEIIRRGRNAHTVTKAKNADVMTYRMSTGFEALWGYLYLNQEQARLEELWEAVKKIGEVKR